MISSKKNRTFRKVLKNDFHRLLPQTLKGEDAENQDSL